MSIQDDFLWGNSMKILKVFKRKIKNFPFSKSVSIFTTLCFVFSIMFAQTTYASISSSLPATAASIDISKNLIPFNLGRVTDAYYSNSKDIVISIQDLHSHQQTQKNISLILSLLDSKYGLDDIYVEGATGSLNTDWLSNIKDSSTKQKVIDILLENGRLTGGELFSVQSNKNNILKGLEDKKVYSANFERLNNIYAKQTEVTNYISLLKNIFNNKSKNYFSKENEKMNKIVQNYKDGKIKTDKYISLLLQKAEQADINLNKYKSIISFAKIVSKQNSFNQEELSEEIKVLLNELKKTLPFNEYKALMKKSSKQELEIEFYFDLIKIANELNLLGKNKFKHTKSFFEYLMLNQTFNTIELSKEEDILINEINDKFAKTENEKEVYFIKNYLGKLSHYLTNKMTAKEYEQFIRDSKKFKLLWAKYIDIDNIIDVDSYLNLVDDFYKYNVERNRIFIKNLTGKNTKEDIQELRIKNANISHEEKIIDDMSNGKKIHVVITGGFHTYGFNKLLEKENISYMVITPNITEDTVKAENLYENIFNEQYNITNTTFANRPITEIIEILNKGKIKDVRPVGNAVEIEYMSGEIFSLNEIKDKKANEQNLLTQKEAQLIADVVVDIQELNKINRENIRAQKSQKKLLSTDTLKQKIRDNLNKITNVDLKRILEKSVSEEITRQALTNDGIKDKKWYKVLTKLGLVSLRESIVVVLEQKEFDNIFTEEILGRINNTEETARETFLQEHEYYGEKEDVTIQLNTAVTSIIDAMNAVYEQVFGYLGIHSIAQLAAKIAGAKKHKEYNLDIYKLSKQSENLLTKGEPHKYKVNFKVYFSLNYRQVEYSTGDKFYTTAPTKATAFNNAVKRAAEEILSKYRLDRKNSLNLTMYLIRQYLKDRNYNIDKNIIEVKEETEKTAVSKTTDKVFTMRKPKYGEYKFNIVIAGLNDSPELVPFQAVYARSPRQAIFEVVYQLCMANENGYLSGGVFKDLKLSKANINDIASKLSDMYDDSKLSEIIKNVKANNAPVLNDNVTVKQKRQLKTGEKLYHVVIPGFNDRAGLEPYQYVYVTDERKAIEQAVLEIIKAKEREEIRGGYYNYRAINRGNKNDILELLSKDKSIKVQDVTEQETREEKDLIQTQVEMQNLSKDSQDNSTNTTLTKNSALTLDSVKRISNILASVISRLLYNKDYNNNFKKYNNHKKILENTIVAVIEAPLTILLPSKLFVELHYKNIKFISDITNMPFYQTRINGIKQIKKNTALSFFKTLIISMPLLLVSAFIATSVFGIPLIIPGVIASLSISSLLGLSKNIKEHVAYNLEHKEALLSLSKDKTSIDDKNVKQETNSMFFQTNSALFKNIVLNSVKSLQRLTYSVLFKDNMEYTIVADANDLSKIKEAELLSKSGIKVNLVLLGDTSLIKESDTRLSTANGELAFCLMDTSNKNLTVYGYDDKLSDGKLINSSTISEQAALVAMLQYINNGSQSSIKILDLSDNLNQNIVTPDIEESAKGMFSTIGVGKTVFNLFSDALKNKLKQTDNMFIKPSLVASNLSSEQIDNFGIENINMLSEQGITTIIISANDDLLKDKSQNLKEILQLAHDKGLKVMFNYGFDLEHISMDSLIQWISEFNERFNQFKENGGIDGLQIDISNSGELATALSVLVPLSKLAEIVNEQNIGSFLSVKMPSDINPSEYAQIFNINNMKLVADYDSNFISRGIALLNTENMIINISADKNGAISISKLSNVFEKNKVSMISFDLPILESMEVSDDFSFNGISVTKFITSIFETTPEGQNIRGINKGRSFVSNRDFVLSEDILNDLYNMYTDNKIDVKRINNLLGMKFKEDVSEYELQGFVKGLLETTELRKINAEDISFDKNEYTNLLLQMLFDYRINEGISFNKDISENIANVLIEDNFREEFKPKIKEIYNILNGTFENKTDTVINILSSLKDNPDLNSKERTMVLDGLLLFLLGYARLDVIDMGGLTTEESIENIKAILRAA